MRILVNPVGEWVWVRMGIGVSGGLPPVNLRSLQDLLRGGGGWWSSDSSNLQSLFSGLITGPGQLPTTANSHANIASVMARQREIKIILGLSGMEFHVYYVFCSEELKERCSLALWVNDNVDEVASLQTPHGTRQQPEYKWSKRVKTDLRNLTAAGNWGDLVVRQRQEAGDRESDIKWERGLLSDLRHLALMRDIPHSHPRKQKSVNIVFVVLIE